MIRSCIPTQIRILADNEVSVIMSTADVIDQDNYSLDPRGCDLTRYAKNPVILWSHNVYSPIGQASNIVVGNSDIRANITFAPTGISPKADEVHGLVRAGIVRGTSVGFDVHESEPVDPKKPFGPRRATRWELLECSFVAIPADTGAMVTARNRRNVGLRAMGNYRSGEIWRSWEGDAEYARRVMMAGAAAASFGNDLSFAARQADKARLLRR